MDGPGHVEKMSSFVKLRRILVAFCENHLRSIRICPGMQSCHEREDGRVGPGGGGARANTNDMCEWKIHTSFADAKAPSLATTTLSRHLSNSNFANSMRRYFTADNHIDTAGENEMHTREGWVAAAAAREGWGEGRGIQVTHRDSPS